MAKKNKPGFLDKKEFLKEYAKYAEVEGMHPDPYAPEHYYNYEQLFNDTGTIMGHLDSTGHLPSEYKTLGHPNRFIKGKDTTKETFPDGGKIKKYANNQGVVMGPVQNPDGSFTLPATQEGTPVVNMAPFEVFSTGDTTKANPYSPTDGRSFYQNLANVFIPDVETEQPVYNPQTGERLPAGGRADYIPIEMGLMPGNLPFKSANPLKQAGIKIAENINPVAGARDIILDPDLGGTTTIGSWSNTYPWQVNNRLIHKFDVLDYPEGFRDQIMKDASSNVNNYLQTLGPDFVQDYVKNKQLKDEVSTLIGGSKQHLLLTDFNKMTKKDITDFRKKNFNEEFLPKLLSIDPLNYEQNLKNILEKNINALTPAARDIYYDWAHKSIGEDLELKAGSLLAGNTKVPRYQPNSPERAIYDKRDYYKKFWQRPNDVISEFRGSTNLDHLSPMSKKLPEVRSIKQSILDFYQEQALKEVKAPKASAGELYDKYYNVNREGGPIMPKKYNTGGTIDGVINAVGMAVPQVQLVANAAKLQGQIYQGVQSGIASMTDMNKAEQDAAFKHSTWARENLGGVLGGLAAPILTGVDAFGAKNRIMDVRQDEIKSQQNSAASFDYNQLGRKSLTFEEGGKLITKYEGPSHEEGGIPLPPYGQNEVEGGEYSFKGADGLNLVLGNIKLGNKEAKQHAQKIDKQLEMRPWETKQAKKKLEFLYAWQEKVKADRDKTMKEDMGPEVFKAAKGGKIKKFDGSTYSKLVPDDWSVYNDLLDDSISPDTIQFQGYKQSMPGPYSPNNTPMSAMPPITSNPLANIGLPNNNNKLNLPVAPFINNTSSNVNTLKGITPQDIKQLLNMNEDVNLSAEAGQMVPPLTEIAYGLGNRDADTFRYDKVRGPQIDQDTIPRMVRDELRLQANNSKEAIRRNAANQGQLLAAQGPLATSMGATIGRAVAGERSKLQNQQNEYDFKTALTNAELKKQEKDVRLNLKRANEEIARAGANNLFGRYASAVKSRNQYDMDLLKYATMLNVGGTKDQHFQFDPITNSLQIIQNVQ